MMSSSTNTPSSVSIIESRLWKYRRILRRVEHSTKTLHEWPKNKLYFTDGKKLLLVPNNFKSISYLNLESSCIRELFNMPYLIQLDEQKHNPLLSEFSKPYERSLLSYIMDLHSENAQSRMISEYQVFWLLSFIHGWDCTKFQKVLDYQRRKTYLYDHVKLIYTEILVACCSDAEFIVQHFRDLHIKLRDPRCYNPQMKLSSSLIKFFLRHLKKVDNFESVKDEGWIAREDFLISGLHRQDAELVKLALEIGCPSSLHPRATTWFKSSLHLLNFWPRKKDDVKVISYNSCEYYILFTHKLLDAILYAYKENVEIDPECVSLIWRAFPVPYLPLEDMLKCYHMFISPRVSVKGKALLSNYLKMSFQDDVPDVYKPRTLKHLCRFVVRQNCRFSEQIQHLPLPHRLKQYVKLEF